MNALAHWAAKRRRRWTAALRSALHSLPAPARPTCCLFCDFEGHFAGDEAAAFAERGTDRLLSLADALGLHITFNVVADLCRTHPQRVARIRDAGHEIACHGFQHERPRDCRHANLDCILTEAGRCFSELEIKPVGFRSPESAWSLDLMPLLVRHGYRWNAERDPATRPYFIRRLLVRMPVRTDDWDLTEPAAGVNGLLDKWTAATDTQLNGSRLVCIGVHEWIIGRRDDFAAALGDWLSARLAAGLRFVSIASCLDEIRRAVPGPTDVTPSLESR